MSERSKIFSRLRAQTETLRNARTGGTSQAKPRMAVQPASASAAGRPSPPSTAGNKLIIRAKRVGIASEVPKVTAQRDAREILHLLLDPSAQLLQPMADFVGAYAVARYHPRTAERISLAAHELADNAMSYGSVSTDIHFSIIESRRTLEICVVNDSSPGRVSSLQAQLERLLADSEKVYSQEMGKSMTGTGGRVSLGLARVAHEAQMELEFELDGMRVTMRARCLR